MDDLATLALIDRLLNTVLVAYQASGVVPDDWRETLFEAQKMVCALFGSWQIDDLGDIVYIPRATVFQDETARWVASTNETLQIILDYHLTTHQMIDGWDDRIREVQNILRHAIEVTEKRKESL